MSDKKITKFIEAETKASDKDRTITITASKEVVDRDGDIVKVKGIKTKNYKKNPVVMMAHNHSQLPIGRAVGRMVWIDGNELKMKIEFATEEMNPLAEMLYKMYKGGFMKGWSISFLPNFEKTEYPEKHKKGARRIFNDVELLEVSSVSIPANAAALGASIGKAFDDGVIDKMEKIALEEWVQESNVEEENNNIDKEDSTAANSDKTITKLQEELIEKDSKIAELELQLQEQEIEEQIDTYDNYLVEIFNEFSPAGSTEEVANSEQMEDEWVDEALIILEGE